MKKKTIGENQDWRTAAACARLMGITKQTLSRQLKREDAPTPNKDGLYHLPTLRAWREPFAMTEETLSLKDQILQEDLKLKKLKVQKAAGELLPIGEVADLLIDAAAQMKSFQEAHEEMEDDPKRKQRIRERGRAHFQGSLDKFSELICKSEEATGII